MDGKDNGRTVRKKERKKMLCRVEVNSTRLTLNSLTHEGDAVLVQQLG